MAFFYVVGFCLLGHLFDGGLHDDHSFLGYACLGPVRLT